jgi:hypothetical protein
MTEKEFILCIKEANVRSHNSLSARTYSKEFQFNNHSHSYKTEDEEIT